MQGYVVDDTQRNNSNTRDGMPVNNNNDTQIPESRQSRNQTDNSICNQSPQQPTSSRRRRKKK